MENNVFSLKCIYTLKKALIGLFLLIHVQALAQNLPNPPANLQNVPAGSFVIPMDTVYQSIVPAGQAPFNLKAYGLVNTLLQNGIPVRWVINSNKQRDDIDFTALAERVAPSSIAATLIDFRGGPFIVPDTVLPCGQSTMEIINSFGNNVAVYRLMSSTTVDVRYTLTHRPKIAVFNNGGNQHIHTKILNAAGIGNYDVMDAANIESLKNCYTFASEPHADSNKVSQAMIDGVRAFVMNGGNFLAQCHAIDTYENRGFFQTTTGIDVVNTTVSHLYPNANLAFAQIHGVTMENSGGSVDNWMLKNGSSWHSYTYPIINYQGSDTVTATGAHLLGPSEIGGNVFYLGGHDYSKSRRLTTTIPNLSNLANVNALRLYLNAALIPSGIKHGVWANAGDPSLVLSCTGSVALGCTPSGPTGSTFLWTPSTGLSCTTCPNPVASPSVTTTYTLQVANTCIAIDTVRVIVGPTPLAQYTNTTVCQGLPTSFTNQSVNSTFWSWNFGDPASGANNVSTLQNPTHTFSSFGSFTVTLISGSDPTCANTIVKTVVVNASPVVTVNSDTICQGQSLLLTASGATTYSWSTGATASSFTVNPSSSASYIVTGTTAGCSSRDTAIVTVSPTMVALTTHTNVSCFGGSDGTATATITGGIPGYTYSWNTSPLQTTSQAANLSRGTYAVTIKDRAGCSATSSAIITEPPLLTATVVVSNAECNSNDGSATVTASGGTQSYTYSWNTTPVQTTTQATNLPAGTYTVTIMDTKSCTTTASATIVELLGISLATTETNVRCNGGSDGTASVTATGGSPGFTYNWNTVPIQTAAQAVNLKVGTYTVTVTDVNGCAATTSASITQPSLITATTISTNVKCNGGNDGTATVTATAGTPGYSYSWNTSPEQTTVQATNLKAGTYIVTVTDANGCKIAASATVTEPPLLTAAATATNVSCNGGSNGTTSVTASGGTPSYSYAWSTSPVQTTFQAINLQAGIYTVTVTDVNNCTTTTSATVIEPSLLTATAISTNVSCNGGSNGTATVTTTGGTPGYSYSWNTNPLQTSGQAIQLKAGTYIVTVTDANGCTTTSNASVTEPTPLSATTITTNVRCKNGSDGTATVTASGGTPGYSYSWNSNPIQTVAQAINLQAGSYTVTVTDANNCTHSISATITEPSPMVLNSTLVNPTCLIGGTATASVAGGTSPYSYSWNSTPIQTTSTANNLSAGNYILFVTDANNCQSTLPIILTAPPMPLADFTFSTGCLGNANEFKDKSSVPGSANSAITSWEWNFGNPSSGSNNTSLSKNPNHTFDSPETFLTRLIVTTDQGCKDTITKPVEIFPIPVVRFGPFADGCESICVDFKDSSTVESGSIQTWFWNFGDASSLDITSILQNPTHCYTKIGSYDVTLKVFTNHGCSAQLTINDMVNVHQSPVVNLGPDQKICSESEGNAQKLFNAGPGTKYVWQPTGDTTQSIAVGSPGTYTVTVTNQKGCSSDASVNVREVCPPRLFVGNAFSPDGDGINDLYIVHHEHVGTFQMLIFNRWGEIIFESRDKNHHWNGIYREEPMPIGVYAWIIIYKGDSNEYRGPYELEGSVTVVR